MQKVDRMVAWNLVYTNQAQKDAKKLSSSGLRDKAVELLEIIRRNPYQNPPSYEKLIGDLSGAISRRINIHHRLVYQVYEKARTVKVIAMFSHYQ
jgi:toxin YoeB